MEELIACLKRYHMSIGSCESFTGGLFCSMMTSIPGASSVLKGGIVTYATQIKEDVVHVDKSLIEQYGVISKECACDMAEKARILLDVDICVSFTGNAGPEVMEGKPVGLVYCGLASKDEVKSYCIKSSLPRNEIREYAVEYMSKEIINFIEK